MNINKIIKKTQKYHYIFVLPTKALLLSSDNNNKYAKKKLFLKIESKIDKLINKPIYRVKLNIDKSKKEIYASIEKYILKNNKKLKKKTLKNKKTDIYFSNELIEMIIEDNTLNYDYIRKVAFAIDKNITSDFLLTVNYYDNIINEINKLYKN